MWLCSEEPSPVEPGDGGGAGRRGASGVRQAPLGHIAAGGAAARAPWAAPCRPAHPGPRACEARPEVGSRGGGERAGGEGRQGQRRVRQGLLGKFAAGGAPARALRAAPGRPARRGGGLRTGFAPRDARARHDVPEEGVA